jgi:hypothetical protein
MKCFWPREGRIVEFLRVFSKIPLINTCFFRLMRILDVFITLGAYFVNHNLSEIEKIVDIN